MPNTPLPFEVVRKKSLLALLVLIFGICMTCIISLYVKTTIEKDTLMEFSITSDQITQKLQDQIKHNNLLLYGVIGRFQSADFMNRRKFKEYVEALRLAENNPGIQAINVLKIVKKNGVVAY